MNLYDSLISILKQSTEYVDDSGYVNRQLLLDKVLKLDKDLLKTLFSSQVLRDEFFKTIDERIIIFDKDKFIKFLEYKNYLKDSYTFYKNKIGLTVNNEYIVRDNSVVLDFPYKDCVLEGGQTKEEQSKNEIFFNEVLAQDEITQLLSNKVLSNFNSPPPHPKKEFNSFKRNQSGLISENLIIGGNNLIALHSIKDQFIGKVKLIYIDPPYNVGQAADTFTYNDRFNHSTWLVFMKNRLEIAKQFLKDDGSLCISISDEEQAYLKILCDEIFGQDKFIGILPRKTRSGRAGAPYNLSKNMDWLLLYSKNGDSNQRLFKRDFNRKYYKTDDYEDEWRLEPLTTQATIHDRPNSNFTMINPKNGEEFLVNPNRAWSVSKTTFQGYLKQGKIVFPSDYSFLTSKQPQFRKFKAEDIEKNGKYWDKSYVHSNHFIDSKYFNAKGTKEILNMFKNKVFSSPKPVALIYEIAKLTTDKNDIILDFFAGSGTTGEAVLRLNQEDGGKRKFILIEQLKEHLNICLQRMNKVIQEEDIDDDYIYFELKKYNQIFVQQIQKAQNSDELFVIWQKMKDKSFLNYNLDIKKQEENIEQFKQFTIEQQKQCLLDLLDKNHLYVPLSSIDDEEFNCSALEKKLSFDFYKG